MMIEKHIKFVRSKHVVRKSWNFGSQNASQNRFYDVIRSLHFLKTWKCKLAKQNEKVMHKNISQVKARHSLHHQMPGTFRLGLPSVGSNFSLQKVWLLFLALQTPHKPFEVCPIGEIVTQNLMTPQLIFSYVLQSLSFSLFADYRKQ